MAKIALIEDEAPIRANLSRYLRLIGHEVVEAENGRAGAELVARELPDIVFCDVRMPEIDGFAVLSAVRSDPRTAEVPFVFVTASADKSERTRGMEHGADAYITKPFSLETIARIITEKLARREP